jgi:hypothetical protein
MVTPTIPQRIENNYPTTNKNKLNKLIWGAFVLNFFKGKSIFFLKKSILSFQ